MYNKTLEISKSGNILVKVIIDDDTRVTRAEIQYLDFFDFPVFTACGKARWNPIDNYDPEIGKGIALGRAWAKYGKKLAAHYEKQAVSVGEARANTKRQRAILELGEVFYAGEEHIKQSIKAQAHAKDGDEEWEVSSGEKVKVESVPPTK